MLLYIFRLTRDFRGTLLSDSRGNLDLYKITSLTTESSPDLLVSLAGKGTVVVPAVVVPIAAQGWQEGKLRQRSELHSEEAGTRPGPGPSVPQHPSLPAPLWHLVGCQLSSGDSSLWLWLCSGHTCAALNHAHPFVS